MSWKDVDFSTFSSNVSIFDGSDASFIISNFTRFQGCWVLRGGCFSFFVLQMVRNMTQIIFRGFVLSRLSTIWSRQHIAATVTGHRSQVQRCIMYREQGILNIPHTIVGMVRSRIHSRISQWRCSTILSFSYSLYFTWRM